MSWAEVKHALNSTLGTDDFQSLDKLISIRLAEWESSLQNHKYEIFETTGSHQYTVPEGVFKIYIAACGGGGGGSGAMGGRYSGQKQDGSGGGGGEAVMNYEQFVTPGEIIEIHIGAGGAGGESSTDDDPNGTPGKSGNDGENTTVGNFLTLKGGKGGSVNAISGGYEYVGGAAGGPGGGAGGNPDSDGAGGLIGSGGPESSGSGGGGGSLGTGGALSSNSMNDDQVIPKRGGGGGGDHSGATYWAEREGQEGADGYVMISIVEITADMINSDTAVSASYTETELMSAYREGVESIG